MLSPFYTVQTIVCSIYVYMVFTTEWFLEVAAETRLKKVLTTTTEFCSDALTDEAIRSWVQLTRRANSMKYVYIQYYPKKLSDISSDKEHFDKAAPIYNEPMKNSGFNEALKFLPTIPRRCHNRRNMIWFDSSFSSNVKTNAGKLLLTLLKKHFPRHHKY